MTTLRPTFDWKKPASWGAVCGTGSYTYKVKLAPSAGGCPSKGGNYTNICATTAPTSTCVAVAGVLQNNKTYCWYVRASNGEASSTSAVWTFTTNVCTPTSPSGSISGKTPVNNQTNVTTPAAFSWTPVSSWGKGCPSNSNTYTVFKKEGVSCSGGGYSTACSTTGTTTNCSASVQSARQYCWYVSGSNGTYAVDSPYYRFSTVYSVEGWPWNSTNKACTADKASNKLQPSGVSGNVTVSISGDGSTNWTPGSASKYRISPSASGSQSVCATPVPAAAGFRYVLSCLNNSDSGIISGSCASLNINASPTNADLGFSLFSQGWITSLRGSVYGGIPGVSVSMGIPASSGVLGGFSGNLVETAGAVLGEGDVTVRHPDGSYAASQDGNKLAKNIKNSKSPWPTFIDFSPPSGAQSISNCSNALKDGSLNPDKVYKASVSCFQTALNSLSGQYKTSKGGVVVLYVTGSGSDTLEIKQVLKAQNAQRRILLVSKVPIKISKNIGSPTVNKASPVVDIEVGIIAKAAIQFESAGDTSGDGMSDDTSIVVDGPLISQAGISFDRDRGLQNTYPAVVVVANPIYLAKITKQERASSTPNYTGLTSSDIEWEVKTK